MSWTRRSLLAAGGSLAAASATGIAEARVLPRDMVPLIGPGYRAVDQDEKGMWQQMERVEEEVAGGDHAAAAGLVEDDHGLPQDLRHLVADLAAHEVGGAASGCGHHELDGAHRVGALRPPGGGDERQQAQGQ